MKRIKTFKDYLLLLEKLKVSEVKNLVKRWKDAGGDKRYDELFKGKHRMLIPFQPMVSPIQVQVVKFLKEHGYEDIDYIEGNCKDPKNPNQQPKISKILVRFNPELKSKFDNDREKAKRAQGDLTIVVSRHAYDIASMTTDRKWHNTSCMEFRAGSNRQYVTQDVMEGSLVTYLINKSDKNIEHPLARLLVKPFVNSDNDRDIILWTEDRIYGENVNGYKESVEKWLKSFQPTIVGNFRLHHKLYADSNNDRTFHKWFNNYDDVYKSAYNSHMFFVYKDGKCGIVDKHNDNIIPIIYDNIVETIYGSNIMLCVKDGKYGLINSRGKLFLDCDYDSIDIPNNSYDYTFILKTNRKYGFVKFNDAVNISFKTEPIYEFLEYIPGSQHLIFRDNGKYGILDIRNNILLSPTYDKITHNYSFKLGDKIGLINKQTFKPEITIDYSIADEIKYKWNNDFAIQKNGKIGLISPEGKILVPCEYTGFSGPLDSNGIIIVLKNDMFGIYYCNEMKELLPCEYMNIINTNNSYNAYFIQNKAEKWGIVSNYKLIVPCEYRTLRMYQYPMVQAWTTIGDNNNHTINLSNGKISKLKIENIINKHALIFTNSNETENRYGICDENFDVVSDGWYYIESFPSLNNKICFKVYKNKDSFGIMNIDKEFILPCEYCLVQRVSNDIFSLKNSITKKCKLVKLPSGEIILDYTNFDNINKIGGGDICIASENNKHSLLNYKTKEITKSKYDHISEIFIGEETSFYRGVKDADEKLIIFKNNKFSESINTYQYILNISAKDYRDNFILCFTKGVGKQIKRDLYDIKGNLVLENCFDIQINNYDDFISVQQNEDDKEHINYKIIDSTIKK